MDNELPTGTVLQNRYEIRERLSQGGMGVVYKARHKVLGRSVAVKIMLKQKDEPAQERFLQEAKLLSRLDHPSLLKLHDCGSLRDGALKALAAAIFSPTSLMASD